MDQASGHDLVPPSALGSQTGCSQGVIQGRVSPEAWTGEGSASEHILVWQGAFPGGLWHWGPQLLAGRCHPQFLAMWASLYGSLSHQSQQGSESIELPNKMKVITFCSVFVEMTSHYFHCILMVRSKSQILHTLGRRRLQGAVMPASRDSLGAISVCLSQACYCSSSQRFSHLNFFCSQTALTTLPLPQSCSHPAFPVLVSPSSHLV